MSESGSQSADLHELLVSSIAQLLNSIVSFTDSDGNEKSIGIEDIQKWDTSTINDAVKAALENVSEFEEIIGNLSQHNDTVSELAIEIQTGLGSVLELLNPDLKPEDEDEMLAVERLTKLKTLLPSIKDQIKILHQELETEPDKESSGPEDEADEAPHWLGVVKQVIALCEHPDVNIQHSMKADDPDPSNLDACHSSLLGLQDFLSKTIVDMQRDAMSWIPLIHRVATLCNHPAVGVEHHINTDSDDDGNLDACLAALSSVEVLIDHRQKEPSVVINQDQAQQSLIEFIEKHPVLLEQIPAFKAAVEQAVQSHLDHIPTRTGMTTKEIEDTINSRVAEYKERAETHYNEFYVNIDGGTPYIMCTKSGRYLTCDFKDKPKSKDWRRTRDFTKAHWFGSLSQCQKLIKKLRKDKVKWAKRLEARKVRLISPDK